MYLQLSCFLGEFLDSSAQPNFLAPIAATPAAWDYMRAHMGGHCPPRCNGTTNPCCGMSNGPVCTLLVGGTRLCMQRANRANLMMDWVLPTLLALNLTRTTDYMILNFANWWVGVGLSWWASAGGRVVPSCLETTALVAPTLARTGSYKSPSALRLVDGVWVAGCSGDCTLLLATEDYLF